MILYQMVKWMEEYKSRKRLKSYTDKHKVQGDGSLLLIDIYEHMMEDRKSTDKLQSNEENPQIGQPVFQMPEEPHELVGHP